MADFTHDGHDFTAQISNCVLHMGGDFAGNLDFEFALNRDLDIDALRSNLQLKDAFGQEVPLQIKGYTGGGDHYDITSTWPIEPAPATIEFLWREGGVSLGHIAVRQVRPEDYDDSDRFTQEQSGGCLGALLFGAAGLGMVKWVAACLESGLSLSL